MSKAAAADNSPQASPVRAKRKLNAKEEDEDSSSDVDTKAKARDDTGLPSSSETDSESSSDGSKSDDDDEEDNITEVQAYRRQNALSFLSFMEIKRRAKQYCVWPPARVNEVMNFLSDFCGSELNDDYNFDAKVDTHKDATTVEMRRIFVDNLCLWLQDEDGQGYKAGDLDNTVVLDLNRAMHEFALSRDDPTKTNLLKELIKVHLKKKAKPSSDD